MTTNPQPQSGDAGELEAIVEDIVYSFKLLEANTRKCDDDNQETAFNNLKYAHATTIQALIERERLKARIKELDLLMSKNWHNDVVADEIDRRKRELTAALAKLERLSNEQS